MPDNGLSLEDFLDNDEDVVITDDPDYDPGSGDPKPEENNEPDENDEPADGDNKDTDTDTDDNQPEDDDDLPDDLLNDGPEGRKTEKPSEEPGEDGDGEGDDPKDEDVVNMLLEKYGVVGGVLDTSDGEKRFDELSTEDQLKALTQIIEHNRPKDESSGPSEEESNLLSEIRESKLSVDEFLSKKASEITVQSEASRMFDGDEYKFEDMDKDIIYTAYLRVNNEGISDEDLTKELELAKQSAAYDSTVELLRKSFIDNREEQKAEFISQRTEEAKEGVKKNAKLFVSAADQIKDISGWELSDDDKNGLLESFVEADDNGKTSFMKEIVENPENALKAMWYLKNAEAKFEQIDSYYKDKIREVYKRGLEDGENGRRPKAPRKKGVKNKDNEQIPKSPTADNVDSLEDWLNNS